jgi:3-oxoacyl-[acyl-carrier protein] reductase
MNNLLHDKVALITGCSRGIGNAIARKFAASGATVVANARTPGSIESLAGEFQNITPAYFDVTDAAAAKAAVSEIVKTFGRLDVLVNNAGVMQDALIGMISSETVRGTFETNVFAVIELTQLAARMMKRRKSGSIINMASCVGTFGHAGQLVYSASKGAVIALTKTAAKELAPFGVRVNAVAPGMIDTDMFRSIGAERVRESMHAIGMGRLGAPEEIAEACAYLASDMSSYVTGQILGVDGEVII